MSVAKFGYSTMMKRFYNLTFIIMTWKTFTSIK